jgi:hypothetical protein
MLELDTFTMLHMSLHITLRKNKRINSVLSKMH